jgi:HEAT repeats
MNNSYEHVNDPRPTEMLLALVLSKDMDADGDDFWIPVRVLQHRLPTEFSKIQTLSHSPFPNDRDVAATILGQNSVREKFDAPECAAVLDEMLNSDSEIASPPLASIILSLGHLKQADFVEKVLRYQNHPNPEVRYATTVTLGGSEDERAIKALIQLSRDADHDVRNWATFGLGSLTKTDSEEIREALVERLGETDDEIRGEALVGLVERGDHRAVEPLCAELDQWTSRPLIKDCAKKLLKKGDLLGDEWNQVLDDLKRIGFQG